MRDRYVMIRMSAEEIEAVDSYRKGACLSRAGYMRSAALGNTPRIIPAINREQWTKLARIGANLNQIARAVNSDTGIDSDHIVAEIEETEDLLRMIRLSLIGA